MLANVKKSDLYSYKGTMAGRNGKEYSEPNKFFRFTNSSSRTQISLIMTIATHKQLEGIPIDSYSFLR